MAAAGGFWKKGAFIAPTSPAHGEVRNVTFRQLLTRNQSRLVEGKAVGPFIVHPYIGDDGKPRTGRGYGWNISYSSGHGVMSGFSRRADALEAARTLYNEFKGVNLAGSVSDAVRARTMEVANEIYTRYGVRR